MKTLLIITFLLLSLGLIAQSTAYHLQFEGGEAKHQYGYWVDLPAGWFEIESEDKIYVYIMYDRYVYRIAKHYSQVRRIKVKRYNHYYEL